MNHYKHIIAAAIAVIATATLAAGPHAPGHDGHHPPHETDHAKTGHVAHAHHDGGKHLAHGGDHHGAHVDHHYYGKNMDAKMRAAWIERMNRRAARERAARSPISCYSNITSTQAVQSEAQVVGVVASETSNIVINNSTVVISR